jgi:glycosyltransferase involved in cell wall biosynthesis
MSEPAVTVVMPVWRADARHFREALESVLAQTLSNFELIVMEDPSESPGTDIVRRLNDPRIRYLLNDRRTSIVAQHNRAVALARSPLIARFDADDVCEPSRLRRQKDFLDSHPAIGVVGCQLRVIDPEGRVIGERRYPTEPAEVRATFKRFNPIANPGVMFRKSVVDEHGGWTEGCNGVARDYEWFSRLAAAGVAFANCDEPLVRYRLHPSSLKSQRLHATLRTTYEVKRYYWLREMGVVDRAMMLAERGLVILPPRLVLWLFRHGRIRRARNDDGDRAS